MAEAAMVEAAVVVETAVGKTAEVMAEGAMAEVVKAVEMVVGEAVEEVVVTAAETMAAAVMAAEVTAAVVMVVEVMAEVVMARAVMGVLATAAVVTAAKLTEEAAEGTAGGAPLSPWPCSAVATVEPSHRVRQSSLSKPRTEVAPCPRQGSRKVPNSRQRALTQPKMLTRPDVRQENMIQANVLKPSKTRDA